MQPFTIITYHNSLCNLVDQQLATELHKKAMSKFVALKSEFKYKKGCVERGLGPVWCVVLYSFRPAFLINCLTFFDLINALSRLEKHLS